MFVSPWKQTNRTQVQQSLSKKAINPSSLFLGRCNLLTNRWGKIVCDQEGITEDRESTYLLTKIPDMISKSWSQSLLIESTPWKHNFFYHLSKLLLGNIHYHKFHLHPNYYPDITIMISTTFSLPVKVVTSQTCFRSTFTHQKTVVLVLSWLITDIPGWNNWNTEKPGETTFPSDTNSQDCIIGT